MAAQGIETVFKAVQMTTMVISIAEKTRSLIPSTSIEAAEKIAITEAINQLLIHQKLLREAYQRGEYSICQEYCNLALAEAMKIIAPFDKKIEDLSGQIGGLRGRLHGVTFMPGERRGNEEFKTACGLLTLCLVPGAAVYAGPMAAMLFLSSVSKDVSDIAESSTISSSIATHQLNLDKLYAEKKSFSALLSQVYLLQGQIYLEMSDFTRALVGFEKAIEFFKVSPDEIKLNRVLELDLHERVLIVQFALALCITDRDVQKAKFAEIQAEAGEILGDDSAVEAVAGDVTSAVSPDRSFLRAIYHFAIKDRANLERAIIFATKYIDTPSSLGGPKDVALLVQTYLLRAEARCELAKLVLGEAAKTTYLKTRLDADLTPVLNKLFPLEVPSRYPARLEILAMAYQAALELKDENRACYYAWRVLEIAPDNVPMLEHLVGKNDHLAVAYKGYKVLAPSIVASGLLAPDEARPPLSAVQASEAFRLIESSIVGETYGSAQAWLALCLISGFGVAQNPEKATLLADEAIAHGCKWGEYVKGLMAEHGIGMEKNITEAKKHYEEASEGGVLPARRLGIKEAPKGPPLAVFSLNEKLIKLLAVSARQAAPASGPGISIPFAAQGASSAGDTTAPAPV